jgi:hypothetical protein
MVVKKKQEFTVSCAHKAGELARILGVLSKAGVNVLAFCGYGHDSDAKIMLVADDDGKAAGALKGGHIEFQSATVVSVTGPSGPGEGARLAKRIADAGLNIEYTYASTYGAGETTIVLAFKDVEGAMRVLG